MKWLYIHHVQLCMIFFLPYLVRPVPGLLLRLLGLVGEGEARRGDVVEPQRREPLSCVGLGPRGAVREQSHDGWDAASARDGLLVVGVLR